jgi:hypothetical protein
MARGMRVHTASEMGLGQVESRPLQAPNLRVNADPSAFGATQGRQLQALGDAGTSLAATGIDIYAREQHRQAVEAEKQKRIQEQETREKEGMIVARRYLDKRLGWVERMREAQEGAAPGAEGFTKGIKAEFDKEKEADIASMPSEQAKMDLEEKYISLELAVMGEAEGFEKQAGKAYRGTQREGLANDILTAITLRPDEYAVQVANGIDAINGMGGTPEEKAEAGAALTNAAAEAHWMGRVRENPGAMLEALKTQEIPGLAFGSRQKLINAAEVDVRQQQVEARRMQAERRAEERVRVAELKQDVGQAMSIMGEGLIPAGMPELRKRVAGTPLAATLATAERAGAAAQELAVLPPAEQLAWFNQRKSQPQTEGSLLELRAAQKVLQATGKAMADGKLLERASEVGVIKLDPVDLTNPESVAARVEASKRVGQHFGVAAPVLTDGEKDAWVADLSKLAPAQKIETAAAIQAAAGAAWPDIMRDLGGKDGLDPTFRHLGLLAGATGNAALVANLMVEAEQTDEKDLKLNLTRQNETEINLDREILSHMDEFMTTVGATYAQGSGSAAGGASKLQNEIFELAKKTTMAMMRTRPMSEAAGLVVGALLNDRYEYEGTYRIPKSAAPYKEGLQRMMSDTLAALTPETVEPKGSESGVPENVRREGYLQQVRNAERWVTLPDETGLLLTDEQGDAVIANGQPVIVKFMGATGGTGGATRLR